MSKLQQASISLLDDSDGSQPNVALPPASNKAKASAIVIVDLEEEEKTKWELRKELCKTEKDLEEEK